MDFLIISLSLLIWNVCCIAFGIFCFVTKNQYENGCIGDNSTVWSTDNLLSRSECIEYANLFSKNDEAEKTEVRQENSVDNTKLTD